MEVKTVSTAGFNIACYKYLENVDSQNSVNLTFKVVPIRLYGGPV